MRLFQPLHHSISLSVGRLVCPSFPFLAFASSFCIVAPTQPHATDAVVYTALFKDNERKADYVQLHIPNFKSVGHREVHHFAAKFCINAIF